MNPYIFLSFSARFKRDNAAMSGIANALTIQEINHFDYRRSPVPSEGDQKEAILRNIDDAVARSVMSIEIITRASLYHESGPEHEEMMFIQYEREKIRQSGIPRLFLCLDSFYATAEAQNPDDRNIRRINISDGRTGIRNPNDDAAALERFSTFEEFMEWLSGSPAFYLSPEYEANCQAFAVQLRKELEDAFG